MWFLSFGLVLAQRMSGAGGVIQYSGVLFDMASATVDSNVSCIVVGAFQLAASGAALLLIDKIGRRTLLLVSSAIVTACLVLLAVYFDRLKTGTVRLSRAGRPSPDLWPFATRFGRVQPISTFVCGAAQDVCPILRLFHQFWPPRGFSDKKK